MHLAFDNIEEDLIWRTFIQSLCGAFMRPSSHRSLSINGFLSKSLCTALLLQSGAFHFFFTGREWLGSSDDVEIYRADYPNRVVDSDASASVNENRCTSLVEDNDVIVSLSGSHVTLSLKAF